MHKFVAMIAGMPFAILGAALKHPAFVPRAFVWAALAVQASAIGLWTAHALSGSNCMLICIAAGVVVYVVACVKGKDPVR